MKYKNARDILPDELLRELQRYASGETLYVPETGEKKCWGEQSGARSFYRQRNAEIRKKRKEGKRVEELAEEYGLSADSIRKIIAV